MVRATWPRTTGSCERPYSVLESWQRAYDGNLLIVLPDTFGTTAFLRDAPDWVADWSGFRIDSKDPVDGGEEVISWWEAMGEDPRDKLLIFSDGLDIDSIERAYRHFHAACASVSAGAPC